MTGACLSAGAAAMLLLDGELPGVGVASPLWRTMRPRALALLSRLGCSSLAHGALLLPGWARAARSARVAAARAGIALDEGQSGSAILVGVLLLGLLSGVLLASAVAGVAAVAGATLALCAWELQSRSARQRELAQEMPAVFRTLSVAMGSGQTLAQAVEYVGSHERGPAAEAFGRLSLRLRCGLGAEEALGRLSEELDAPGVELLATALVVSHRTGSPLRELLVRSARLVERQGEFQRLLSVKTAQVRLSVRIVCALPAVLVILLALISPDFQRGLLTPGGVASVVIALGLDAVALLIIRRLMRGVV